MKVKQLFLSLIALATISSCINEAENDTLVKGAATITIDKELAYSVNLTVSSRQPEVVSCIISEPQKYDGTEGNEPYRGMDAITKYALIMDTGTQYPLSSVTLMDLEKESDYYVGAMGLDEAGNVITAPVFTVFHTGTISLAISAGCDGRDNEGTYHFSATLTPNEAAAEVRYVFSDQYIASTKEELMELILQGGEDVKTVEATGSEVDVTATSPRRKARIAAIAFDEYGNYGPLVEELLAGEPAAVTVTLTAAFDRMEGGKYIFAGTLNPDTSTAEVKYIFSQDYVNYSDEQLSELIMAGGADVKTITGSQEVSAESTNKMAVLAAIPFDEEGNDGNLQKIVITYGISINLGEIAFLEDADNDNIYEVNVAVPAGEQEFTISIDGVEYGALPYSGVAGVGTITGKEGVAYPAYSITNQAITYTVSKAIGRMSAIAAGGNNFWTNVPAGTEMYVRVDLSNGDGIPRYYFREKEADNVVFHESFDLFAYTGDYINPANGCLVDMSLTAVDGTEAGVMTSPGATYEEGQRHEVGYKKTWFDWPEQVYGKALAPEVYIANRDMTDWVLLNCGEKVGGIQLSVSGTNTFGVVTSPKLKALTEPADVVLEIDMARFSTASKNRIAIRLVGGGNFSAGEVTVDGQQTVDLTEIVTGKDEYIFGYEKNICPPSAGNSNPNKPISHFKLAVAGATAETRIVIDTALDKNASGSNANASRCYLFDLKVTK